MLLYKFYSNTNIVNTINNITAKRFFMLYSSKFEFHSQIVFYHSFFLCQELWFSTGVLDVNFAIC